MAGQEAQQGACRAIGLAAVLFPVLQGIYADANAAGELLLRQSEEATQGDQIPWLPGAGNQPLSLSAGEGSHFFCGMECLFHHFTHLKQRRAHLGIDMSKNSR